MLKKVGIVLVCLISLHMVSLAASVEMTDKSVDNENGRTVIQGLLIRDTTYMREVGLSVFDESGNLCCVMQQTAEQDGTFVFDFLLPKNGGLFSFILSHCEDNTNSDDTVYYLSTAEQGRIIEKFKNASADSVDGLYLTYKTDGSRPIFNIEFGEFYEQNKTAVNSLIVSEIAQTENLSIDAAERIYKTSLAVVACNLADAADMDSILKQYSADLGIIVDDLYYENKKDEIIALFLTYRNSEFTDADELIKSFDKAKAVISVNSAKKDTMTETVKYFAKVWDNDRADFTEIINIAYAEFEEVEVNKALVDCDFKTVSEIIDAFQSRYNQLSDEKQRSNSRSGGAVVKSSGGGGIRVNVAKPAPVSEVADTDMFSDIGTVPWAEDAIEFLAENDVVDGIGNGNFQPNRAVTRAEFVKMLVQSLSIVPGGTNTFTDVEANAWYEPYLSAAHDKSIISGKEDGSFGPDEFVTRQDMVLMVYNASELYNIHPAVSANFDGLGDYNMISDYAQEAVLAMYSSGYINGKGNKIFDPLGNTTRAEAAVLIYKVLKNADN